MPRVVPSQIVALIDGILSEIQVQPGRASGLDPIQSAKISAVIDLCSELPDEFLALRGDDYSHYRISIGELKVLLRIWENRDTHLRRAEMGARCLRIMRDLLAKCPDEIPSASTAELSLGLMHERPVDPDLVYKTGTQA
jgi:hypothetical protein